MLAELDLLERTGEWSEPNPEPEVDPQMVAPPLQLSDRTVEGRWAPFAKHPVHIALLRLPWVAGGHAGVVVASLASVVVAAWAAALIVGRDRPGTEAAARWAVGFGSPLIFDRLPGDRPRHGRSDVARRGSAAVVALDEGPARRRRVAVGAATVLVALTALIRSEGVLGGPGARRRVGAGRDPGPGPRRGRAWARRWARWCSRSWCSSRSWSRRSSAASRSSPPPRSPVRASWPTGGRASASPWSIRATASRAARLSLAVSTVLLLAAGLVWRLRRNDRLATRFVAGAAALGVVRLGTMDFLVPGLLQATPVVTLALRAAHRVVGDGLAGQALVPTAGAFVAAVVATQYPTGGRESGAAGTSPSPCRSWWRSRSRCSRTRATRWHPPAAGRSQCAWRWHPSPSRSVPSVSPWTHATPRRPWPTP